MMNNKGNISKLILLLAPVALLLDSCIKEYGAKTDRCGERDVEMTFKTQGTATRAAIAAEDAVKDVTLLVFDGSGSTSRFLYSRYAWRTSSVMNRFRTTLRMGGDLTIYFAANTGNLIKGLEGGGQLVGGTTTWSEVKELLVLDTPTGFDLINKGLPMWGHKSGVDITDAPDNNLGTVKLLRAVASTDIAVTASNFTLEKVHVVFAPDKGYLAYDPSLLSDEQVTAPQSPSDMTTTVDWYKSVASIDNGMVNNYFYMYDNATSLTPSGENKPTKVILEGVWNETGGSGNTTFYPLSFRDGNVSSGYVKKQVTRNNKYMIVVTNVNGDGWKDMDEAKSADDINVEYDVIAWNTNEDGRIDVDGPKYFYRETACVVLQHNANSTDFPNTAEIRFRTNYTMGDIKMAFTPDIAGVAGTVSNDRFKADVSEVDPDGLAESGDEYTCFRFTALKDYAADTDNPSTLHVTCGRIHFIISVRQADRTLVPWDDGGDTTFES